MLIFFIYKMGLCSKNTQANQRTHHTAAAMFIEQRRKVPHYLHPFQPLASKRQA
jgi:hypothetical protein